MKTWLLIAAMALAVAGMFAAPACCQRAASDSAPPASSSSPPPLRATGPGVDPFVYAAGTAGTVTVPAGQYVVGLACHASGAGASLTITPKGPTTTDAGAGPAIPVPSGMQLGLGRPVIPGSQAELGQGTVLVFTSTDSYVVWMSQGGS